MKISAVNNSRSYNNPNFGMALYMPTKGKLAKDLGREMAKRVDSVRPELQKLAEDVDIIIEPILSGDGACMGKEALYIEVRKPIPKDYNIFKKIYTYLKDSFNSDSIHVRHGDVTENLILTTKTLISNIKK